MKITYQSAKDLIFAVFRLIKQKILLGLDFKGLPHFLDPTVLFSTILDHCLCLRLFLYPFRSFRCFEACPICVQCTNSLNCLDRNLINFYCLSVFIIIICLIAHYLNEFFIDSGVFLFLLGRGLQKLFFRFLINLLQNLFLP